MTNKKCSKILTDERTELLDNGFIVFYGSKDNSTCDVVEIIVKGLFTPVEDKKNYKNDAEESSVELQRKLSSMLSNEYGIDKHFIVSTDFTERGIHMGSKCKLKYQMYIRPLEQQTIEKNKPLVMTIVSHANKILTSILESHGFSITS